MTNKNLSVVDNFMEYVDSLEFGLSTESREALRGWALVELTVKGRIYLGDGLNAAAKLSGGADRLGSYMYIDFMNI